jgi:hypothetical protein
MAFLKVLGAGWSDLRCIGSTKVSRLCESLIESLSSSWNPSLLSEISFRQFQTARIFR